MHDLREPMSRAEARAILHGHDLPPCAACQGTGEVTTAAHAAHADQLVRRLAALAVDAPDYEVDAIHAELPTPEGPRFDPCAACYGYGDARAATVSARLPELLAALFDDLAPAAPVAEPDDDAPPVAEVALGRTIRTRARKSR